MAESLWIRTDNTQKTTGTARSADLQHIPRTSCGAIWRLGCIASYGVFEATLEWRHFLSRFQKNSLPDLTGRFFCADSALGEGRRFFRGGRFAFPFLEFESDLVFIDFEKCGKWPAFLGDESMDEIGFA